MLDILRQDGEPAPRSPTSTLARLGDLVSQATAPGLEVRAETEGTVSPLPFGVDVAGYRIVQEALTNVARHAGPATAAVRITYSEEEVTVQVDDNGRGPAARQAPGQRQRDRRDAGTGGRARRGALRRSPPGRRIPGPGPASGERRPMIRVLLADDQVLVRAGFRALLDAQDDIEVAGQAGDGEQAVRLAHELTSDVVLMDIRMPGTDGLAATRQITAGGQLASVRVVILTTFELDEYVFEAIRSEASGFLVKDTEPDELVQAVRVVASGDALLSPSVTRRLIGEFAARAKEPHNPRGLEELTDREQEVLALVGNGLSNNEIAKRLYVSPATAKTHVSRAMIKLRARDRAQLVVIAYESGLVRPGWHA